MVASFEWHAGEARVVDASKVRTLQIEGAVYYNYYYVLRINKK